MINTNGNCINIYSRENCVGQFIRVQTSRFSEHVRNMAGHRWEDDILVDHEKMIVGSIGPCLEKCDPQNWVGMRKDIPTNVTLYSNVGYNGEEDNDQVNLLRPIKLIDPFNISGTEYTYSIPGMQCITIPLLIASIKISGTATTTCVELHGDPSCGGNSVQLRPGYPQLYFLWGWGFHRGQDVATLTQSISLCGYSCPAVTTKPTHKTMTPTTKTTVLEEPVTNQSKFHVHENVNDSQGEEQTLHLPVWAILLIILGILSIMGLAGFAGVYFFPRYRNEHLPSYEVGRAVIYKSQSENL